MEEGAGVAQVTAQRTEEWGVSNPDTGNWLFHSPKRPYGMKVPNVFLSSSYMGLFPGNKTAEARG
jgi:hypothetical protein